MEIFIGDKIRKLRHARNLTQEEMAAHLGISFQAISKWERGEGYPDITLLPTLAHYFDVTVDALLGTEEITAREVYDGINRQWEDNRQAKRHRENVELMRSALKDYPNDPLLLVQLSTSLERLDGTEVEKEDNLRQSAAVQEQILRYCDDCEVRSATMFNICFTYDRLGEREKAIAQAKKLPNLYKARENALVYFLTGEEKRQVSASALAPLQWAIKVHLNNLAGSDDLLRTKVGEIKTLLAEFTECGSKTGSSALTKS